MVQGSHRDAATARARVRLRVRVRVKAPSAPSRASRSDASGGVFADAIVITPGNAGFDGAAPL